MTTRRVLILGFVFFLLMIFIMNSASKNKKTITNDDLEEEQYDYYYIGRMTSRKDDPRCGLVRNRSDYVDVFDFEKFDNHKQAARDFIVPNLVHLIYSNTSEITFDQMIGIFSIFLNQNPHKILIHCDKCGFRGPYWDIIQSSKCLKSKLVVRKIPIYESNFDKKISMDKKR